MSSTQPVPPDPYASFGMEKAPVYAKDLQDELLQAGYIEILKRHNLPPIIRVSDKGREYLSPERRKAEKARQKYVKQLMFCAILGR